MGDLSDDPADNDEQLEEGHMVDCDQKCDNDDSHNLSFSDFKAKLNVPSSESESSGEDLEFDWNSDADEKDKPDHSSEEEKAEKDKIGIDLTDARFSKALTDNEFTLDSSAKQFKQSEVNIKLQLAKAKKLTDSKQSKNSTLKVSKNKNEKFEALQNAKKFISAKNNNKASMDSLNNKIMKNYEKLKKFA